MSLIKKSNELVIPTTVKMMIYGQAGMGKSTVALSAPKPLLLDFDNGVKRMNMAHLENIDTVQVTSWSDVQQVLQEDLSAYQTIVVDTIGKMMDFIITHKCGTRQPSIRDWSSIFAEFSMPWRGERCRGYVSYGIREKEKDWWIDSWLNYTHQKSILQYPVMTAAQNRKQGGWLDNLVFFTVQDAMQVLPGEETD